MVPSTQKGSVCSMTAGLNVLMNVFDYLKLTPTFSTDLSIIPRRVSMFFVFFCCVCVFCMNMCMCVLFCCVCVYGFVFFIGFFFFFLIFLVRFIYRNLLS